MSKAFNWWDGTIFFNKKPGQNYIRDEIFTGHTVQAREVWVSKVDDGAMTFNSNGLSNYKLGERAYEIIQANVHVYYPFPDDANTWRGVPCVDKANVENQIQLVFHHDNGSIYLRRRGTNTNLRVRGYIVYTKRLPTDN